MRMRTSSGQNKRTKSKLLSKKSVLKSLHLTKYISRYWSYFSRLSALRNLNLFMHSGSLLFQTGWHTNQFKWILEGTEDIYSFPYIDSSAHLPRSGAFLSFFNVSLNFFKLGWITFLSHSHLSSFPSPLIQLLPRPFLPLSPSIFIESFQTPLCLVTYDKTGLRNHLRAFA